MIIRQEWITRKDAQENRNRLYVFGDNFQRKGLGGLAKQLRGEINSVGIATKKYPSMLESAFFTDDDFEEFFNFNKQDFDKLIKCSSLLDIVIPKNGLGTATAELDIRAPKIFLFLQNFFDMLEKRC